MTIENPRDTSVAVLVVVLGLLVGIAGPAAAGADAPVPAVNAQEGIGLKGYDPIAYFINLAPRQGSAQYSFFWKGITYRFASGENCNGSRLTLRSTFRSMEVTVRMRYRSIALRTSIRSSGRLSTANST